MSQPEVTVVVAPRESFSQARISLESVLTQRGREPFDLVYVDGRSPRRVQRYLDTRVREAGFTLLRTDRYLSPNEARNLALPHVNTPYVAFIDNNTVVAEGWLDALLACARETNAAFVSPVYCVGALSDGNIHVASGEGRLEMVDGRRHLIDLHRHCGRRLSEIHHELRRAPCEVAEFHCVLVRTDVVAEGFDAQLPAALEHIDFCIQADVAPGGGWFEPASVVTYLPPPPLTATDVPYFTLRWSKAWIDASFDHFAEKWQLPPDDSGLRENRDWLENYRWKPVRYLRGGLRRTLGPSAVRVADDVTDRAVSVTLVRGSARAR
jgi:hypothetical protein